ncbi:hypothetical protein FJT64_018130 [Amphibalanus amphitrite]|uniref:Uncharacterized protein n=1 Tax=Amphibalanus amphitrite TaxID=1232801 RepID=A0A6A4WV40_AMPAM|nr:hypothetical protein FJT64_018130 [Amphibalanus amphitrite]
MPANSVIWLICIVIAVLICVLWVLICYIGFCKLRLQRRSDEESLLGTGLFVGDLSLPGTPPSPAVAPSNTYRGGPLVTTVEPNRTPRKERDRARTGRSRVR